MKRLPLLALLLATPVVAQDAPVETVNAYGSALAGVWHGGLVQFGLWNTIIPFSDPKLMGVVDAFCRMAPRRNALGLSCLQISEGPSLTTDGTQVHYAAGSIFAGGGFDGALASPDQLRGHYWVRRWGVRYRNPSLSTANRLTPDPATPDKAGKAALLRQILTDGLAGVAQDADAVKRNGPAFSVPALGALQAISYLGQETKWDWPPPPEVKLDMAHLRVDDIPRRTDFFSVYWVRFADGERLCGLHQRDDGVLDALRCV